jgi:hypothetical protein
MEEIDKPKKFKREQALREIENKPLKKFSHIPPVASPHGEAGRNTVIANQGEGPWEDGSGTAKWVVLAVEGRSGRREGPRTAQESGRIRHEGIGEARECYTWEKEEDLKPRRRTAVGNVKRLSRQRCHEHHERCACIAVFNGCTPCCRCQGRTGCHRHAPGHWTRGREETGRWSRGRFSSGSKRFGALLCHRRFLLFSVGAHRH